MSQPIASVQLIVFGEQSQTDFEGVLKAVHAAGFPAIEAGNLFTTHGEEETRRLLDQYQIQVSGAHFGYGEYANAEHLETHIAYAKALGIRNLMCSGVSNSKTADGYHESAQLFNQVGKRLADEGMRFQYHNHAWEFDDLGGINGMQILDAQTDPAFVKYNLDVFWIYYGHHDPVAFIEAHADRTGYFHFKDGNRTVNAEGKTVPKFMELGHGSVNLKAAYQAALAANAEWIVAEQDRTELTPAESVAISRQYLRDLGV